MGIIKPPGCVKIEKSILTSLYYCSSIAGPARDGVGDEVHNAAPVRALCQHARRRPRGQLPVRRGQGRIV